MKRAARLPRSADFQSAVSPISNRLTARPAGRAWSSDGPQAGSAATQQIGNLRYGGWLTLALAVLFAEQFIATQLSAAEPRNISAIQSLKPGKGRELIQVNCIPCHSTAIIAATHATRERWDELITTMQQKHGLWPLVPAVRNQILDYLAATQPPSDPALDAAKQTPWAEPLYRPNPLW